MKQLTALLLALLFCLSFAACGKTQEDKPTTEVPTQTTETTTTPTTETTTAPSTTEAVKDWNVTPVQDDESQFSNGYPFASINGITVDSKSEKGIFYTEDATGKKTVVADDGEWIYAFDGETILYLSSREDPTVDFDKSYVVGVDDHSHNATSYQVDDVMKYDIKTGKKEKLFTKYCAGGGIIYFNDSDVYYADILESQIGYRNGYDPYDVKLYRYDLTTGKRELLSKEQVFDERLIFIDGTPYILLGSEMYDVSKHAMVDVNANGFCWAYKDRWFFITEDNDENEEDAMESTIVEYNRKTGATKELYSYCCPEDMQYVGEDFGNRYVLVDADVGKESNEYTTTYSASSYVLYDLLTQETVNLDPSSYNGIYSVDNVLVTWFDLEDGEYEISYIDDDGNSVVYGRVKSDSLPDRQSADGYYLSTDEYDEYDHLVTTFVPYPLDFLKQPETDA